jgi:hypothetical protein
MVIGAIFPLLSFITGAIVFIEKNFIGKRSSPVFIPVIGPVLFDIGLAVEGKTGWLLLLPWLLDIGTLAFFYMAPSLIKDWWQTSALTQLVVFKGSKDIQEVVISLHSSGRYHLDKKWNRQPDEPGINALSEEGVYESEKDRYVFHSDSGFKRILNPVEDSFYKLEEPEEINENFSIRDFILEKVKK